MSDALVITADDIRQLSSARFAGEAVLVIAAGEPRVMPARRVEYSDVECIVITASDVHTYCGGELDDALAERLAADLTRELADEG